MVHPSVTGHTSVADDVSAILQTTKSCNGSIVFLAGESGIGKTTLARRVVQESGVTSFIGYPSGGQTHHAYGLIASVLRDYMSSHNQQPPEIGHLTPYLNFVLPELGPPPGEKNNEALTAALIRSVMELAADGPAALMLDDLHAADESSLDLLIPLADELNTVPLCIIGLYNPGGARDQPDLRRVRDTLRRRQRLKEFYLKPFDRDATRDFVAQSLEAEPEDWLTDFIYEKSGGLPLYIVQLLDSLQAAGALVFGADQVDLKTDQEFSIPESLKDMIVLRLADCSRDAISVLEFASQAGKQITTAILPRSDGIQELLDKKLLVPAGEGRYTFQSSLVRDVVAQSLDEGRSRQIHTDLAERLSRTNAPPGEIAEHWMAAGQTEQARSALMSEAKRSCELYAFRDASRTIRKLLRIWPEHEQDEQRFEMMLELAHCAQMTGEFSEAEQLLLKLIQSDSVKEYPGQLAELYQKLAVIYELRSSIPKMVEARRKAAEAFVEAGQPIAASQDWLLVAEYSIGMGLYQSAREVLEQARELILSDENTTIHSRILGLLGYVLAMQGQFDEAEKAAESGLSLALEHQQNAIAGEVYRRLAGVYEYSSRFPEAQKAYARATSYCETHSVEQQIIPCLGCMAWIQYRLGEWKDAESISGRVLNASNAPPVSTATAQVVLGLIHGYRGRFKTSRKYLIKGLDLSRANHIDLLTLILTGAMAQMLDLQQSTEDAEHYYFQTLELWENSEDQHDVLSSLSAGVYFFANQRDENHLARISDTLNSMAAGTGNPEAAGALSYAIGETQLLHGNDEGAVQHFQNAAEKFGEVSVPLELLRTQFRLGETLIKIDDLNEAISHFNDAYRTAKNMGTRPYMDLIRKCMEKADIHPDESRDKNSRERAARAGLTRRQLEVARHIATGMTNKEIAEQLFLSPRTIEMHVSNLLDRLDCRSRSEAVKKLSEMQLI